MLLVYINKYPIPTVDVFEKSCSVLLIRIMLYDGTVTL